MSKLRYKIPEKAPEVEHSDKQEELRPEVRRVVENALGKLDKEHCAVLKTAFWNGVGCDPEELAESLGTTLEAADSLHQNALRALFSSPSKDTPKK